MDERDNVISLETRRLAKAIADGHSGWFADVAEYDLEGSLLQQLGEAGGPYAVGLMAPLNDRAIDYDRPEFCGWALQPEHARALAKLLNQYADDCEKGYP